MSKIVLSPLGLWALAVLTLSVSSGCVHVERQIGLPGELYARHAPDHDQTPPEALKILSQQPQAVCTGIFVVPAPDIVPLEYSVKMVPCMTYAQSVRRGFHCPVFKFIPEKLAGFRELAEKAAGCVGGSCSRYFTIGSVDITTCRAPCACHYGTCASIPGLELERLLEQDVIKCPDVPGPRINPSGP